MVKINCLLIELGVYDEIHDAIGSLDCTGYEDGEHMATLVCTPMAHGKSMRPGLPEQIDRIPAVG